jgi:exodeoxyribonuclease V alpha subunit
MLTEIRIQIERITYQNEENGYTIAKAKIGGRHDLITVVGNLFSVNAGEVLKLQGQWQTHPKFGEQFRVSAYETVVPATITGIEKYLGSGLIKGIGPVMAKRLVSMFGLETLGIIETDIQKLRQVQGIGEKRIEMIRTAWDDQKEIRDVMLFLQGHGVTPSYGAKIFKQYGKESISVVRDNPYRLATDIFGIGFIKADKIAEKLNIPKESQMRAEAGILYVLHQLSDEGHVCYPYELLIEKCGEILDVGREIIVQSMAKIAMDKRIVIEDFDTEGKVHSCSRVVYLTNFYMSETGAAQKLKSLLGGGKMTSFDRHEAIEWVQGELGIRLGDNQKQAVAESLDRNLMVITGGPGTGKTTVINAIMRIAKRLGQKVLLAAPTGRAARRMTEATGQEAKTIHRLLEFNPREGRFRRDENAPLDAGMIVIDETSMVDAILMYHLLSAVPGNATVIFVGDVDQLPSVGAGTVLKDMIDSGIIPTVRLTEIFRQARESLIIVNAHRVNNGEMPIIPHDGGRLHDFYCFQADEPEQAVEKIIGLCREKIPEKFGYDPVEDIQVLTPMHRGVEGAANLNAELQKALNPSQDELVRSGKVLKRGDKVMQIRNNYEKEVFNGDVGRISRIDRETQEVTVQYDGRPVSYEYSDLDEIVLAYAVSVHKSQGSEYPVIVMPIHTQHYMLLQRNLLYTGITRGKRLVILVGTMKAIAIAVKNSKTQHRHTLLKERLLMDR